MKDKVMELFEKSKTCGEIKKDWYAKYEVKNGLRNEDGTGVLVGLTKISDVVGYHRENGKKIDDYGKLIYRGIDIKDIVNHHNHHHACLFEEVCFLILFGFLPNPEEFALFRKILSKKYKLPNGFLESKILRSPTYNLMNKLQQDVLTLYAYDKTPDDVSNEHIIDQGLHLVAKMPSLICYNYMSKIHYFDQQSMFIHHIDNERSIAENILYMLRSDQKYTKKEAEVLDVALVLHADHGGGNNSTFVNVVMSSTGTDIYSSFAGAIGSLKGPKHGGANLRVSGMMEEVIEKIGYTEDKEEIRLLIKRILNKDFYDNSGLIYGMGHAVYTLSDPRSEILEEKAAELAQEKGLMKEFRFYQLFEQVAQEEMFAKKGIHVSSNVDFYSGFVYKMLNIPQDLYTLLFVCARSIGWLAHNLENQLYSGKIVRPATKYVGEYKPYVSMEERGKK
ncbi:MAG: citrate synthase [Erysipelotrichia bacterium]|nr:citrate synthase [Erysipelotrichia bacterium]NCC54584.1 citrate synthase [Erysipelotrichia bacterium]